MMTSIRLGGGWTYEIISGIMLRDVADLPTTTFEFVASSNIQISKYTDQHDVDEDLTAFSIQGGYCRDDDAVGLTHRNMTLAVAHAISVVASLKNKD